MNTISPGPVETPLWLGSQGVAATVARASGIDVDTARKQIVESQGGFATGRFTRPDEVADLVLLLASERAGERHRFRLRHRRRSDKDSLISRSLLRSRANALVR
jgi:NAD(P)-dependent dehydrogenase (short-subunit alcohol dehydrogenase family)